MAVPPDGPPHCSAAFGDPIPVNAWVLRRISRPANGKRAIIRGRAIFGPIKAFDRRKSGTNSPTPRRELASSRCWRHDVLDRFHDVSTKNVPSLSSLRRIPLLFRGKKKNEIIGSDDEREYNRRAIFKDKQYEIYWAMMLSYPSLLDNAIFTGGFPRRSSARGNRRDTKHRLVQKIFFFLGGLNYTSCVINNHFSNLNIIIFFFKQRV